LVYNGGLIAYIISTYMYFLLDILGSVESVIDVANYMVNNEGDSITSSRTQVREYDSQFFSSLVYYHLNKHAHVANMFLNSVYYKDI